MLIFRKLFINLFGYYSRINRLTMKNIFTILAGVFIFSSLNAQILAENDGMMYRNDFSAFTGTYREYYPDGTIRIEADFADGVYHGSTILYYENGNRKEVRSYRYGQMDGTWVTWNENRVKTGEAGYRHGKKHGPWKIWDDTGRLRYEMFYDMGKKAGTWKIYNEQGKAISIKKYE